MPETAAVSAIPEVISKAASRGRVTPSLDDYARVEAGFSWENAARGLSGLPGGGINIAHEAVDRQAAGARAGHLALRCLRAGGARAGHWALRWLGRGAHDLGFGHRRRGHGAVRRRGGEASLGIGAGS